MGEGNPGMAVTRAYYDRARELRDMGAAADRQHSSRPRAHGCCPSWTTPARTPWPPISTYSKALNAAQYPLSVLAMTEHAASLYVPGIYGNTMTGNLMRGGRCHVGAGRRRHAGQRPRPRPRVRRRARAPRQEIPGVIVGVQGTGLLLAATLADHIPVVGEDGVELECRQRASVSSGGTTRPLRRTSASSAVGPVMRQLGRCSRHARAGADAAAK